MRAGPLRHRIAIDEPVADQSPSGAEIVTWTERAANVSASVEPLTGREKFRADAITADIDVRIRTRWLPLFDEMTAKWRIRHLDKSGTTDDGKPGVVYNVVSPPANLGTRDREIEILANRGLNQG